MKKLNKQKQQRDVKQAKRKHAKEVKKKRENKVKSLKILADKIKEGKAEKETHKMQEEVRKIQNKGLTFRKPKVQ